MARQEDDREDLLREATALVERTRLQVPGFAEPVVAGFRRDGSLSLFLGSDSVYQFNSRGKLRRAFLDHLLYKAERGTLISLRRVRTESTTQLVRCELAPSAEAALLERIAIDLARLQAGLDSNGLEVLGNVPPEADVVDRLRSALSARPMPLRIATRPNAS
jgi:hypothetical protein